MRTNKAKLVPMADFLRNRNDVDGNWKEILQSSLSTASLPDRILAGFFHFRSRIGSHALWQNARATREDERKGPWSERDPQY
jgi:hypothetical protein